MAPCQCHNNRSKVPSPKINMSKIKMILTVKKPGLEMATEQSELDLSYGLRYQVQEITWDGRDNR
ncbi:hypothetical protein E2562_033775 [Oryza meyeriana var. granulata]|uniref:Uncharacterized protein n=1 Tax=Oryza meyeriana var. granulata TaxID=110450 RepID=A0A6G1C1Z1_9ORYZ|nr:hypothetical protein E2562_033775 [Oryza meyeriana var. granulata]